MIHEPVMPQTKIEGFFSEFPWLSNFIDKGNSSLRSIYVRRVENDILDQSLSGHDYRSKYGDEIQNDRIIALNKNGRYLGEVGLLFIPGDHTRSWWQIWKRRNKTRKIQNETLLAAVERISQNNAIHFFVVIDEINVSYNRELLTKFHEGLTVTIYKAPKEFNMKQWLDHVRKKDLSEIKKEVAALDKV